jgi:hypothetical protein
MYRTEILSYVKDPAWQKFRESLKGLPTTEKLDRLAAYRKVHYRVGSNADLDDMDWTPLSRAHQVRIDNYINALRRGGQLNHKLEVVR